MATIHPRDRVYVVVGRSGAGKGTQVDLLARKFRLRKIVTGDLFRALAASKAMLGRSIKRIVERGGLPPGWIASYLWTHELIRLANKKRGVVIEGAPRRMEEALLLDKVVPFLFGSGVVPVLIHVSEAEAMWRLSNRRVCSRCKRSAPYYPRPKNPAACAACGGRMVRRKDDSPKAIRARMRFYEKSVKPVLRYYARQNRLIRVNGEQPIADVFKELLVKLGHKK